MRNTPRIIASALGLSAALLLAPVAHVYAQDAQQTDAQKKKDEKDKKKDQKQDQKDQKKDEKAQQQQGRGRAVQPQPAPQPQPQPVRTPHPVPQPQPQPVPQPQPAPQPQPSRHPRPVPQPNPPQPGGVNPAPSPRPPSQRQPRPQPPSVLQPPPQPSVERRLPPQRQHDLIEQERLRRSQYNQHLQQQQNIFQQRARSLQQQKRTAQYRFQQQYLQHLRQQQIALQNAYDYNRDPYFYTAPSFRYSRGGRYYEVNRYAGQLLQDAVNYGYEEGFDAGQADREDHWHFDYQGSYAYQDADFGYTGLYVDRDEYGYYFREGFRRGYEDGYYSRYRYGVRVSGNLRILGDILKVIIDLRPLH